MLWQRRFHLKPNWPQQYVRTQPLLHKWPPASNNLLLLSRKHFPHADIFGSQRLIKALTPHQATHKRSVYEGSDSVSQRTRACLLHWAAFATGQGLRNGVTMNVVRRCEPSCLFLPEVRAWRLCVPHCLLSSHLPACWPFCHTAFVRLPFSGLLDRFRMPSCDPLRERTSQGRLTEAGEEGQLLVGVFVFPFEGNCQVTWVIYIRSINSRSVLFQGVRGVLKSIKKW